MIGYQGGLIAKCYICLWPDEISFPQQCDQQLNRHLKAIPVQYPCSAHNVKNHLVKSVAVIECHWKFLVTVSIMYSDGHYLPRISLPFHQFFLQCNHLVVICLLELLHVAAYGYPQKEQEQFNFRNDYVSSKLSTEEHCVTHLN